MKYLAIAAGCLIATLTIWRLRRPEERAHAYLWDEDEDGIQRDERLDHLLQSVQSNVLANDRERLRRAFYEGVPAAVDADMRRLSLR